MDVAHQLEILSQVTTWLFAAIISAYAAVIAWQLLIGNINMMGLFRDKVTGSFSPGRVQLLLFVLVAAGEYFMAILDNLHNGGGGLSNPSHTTLALLAGSSVFYAGGKSAPVWGRLLRGVLGR